jgi:hypothetical protein
VLRSTGTQIVGASLPSEIWVPIRAWNQRRCRRVAPRSPTRLDCQ